MTTYCSPRLGQRASCAWLWLAIMLTGCATTTDLGTPLARADSQRGYRFSQPDATRRKDDLLLVTTFSGGGTRAAAFSYGVLQQLRRDSIEHDGVRKPLLDEVDLISAVSGGGVTAASYALEGDALFETFEQRLLKHNLRRSLWLALLNPRTLARLATRRFARGDLIAEELDRRLFRGATFDTLLATPARPFMILNATDLSAGARFEFTQTLFDALCLDLAPYSLARAVAASGAAPPTAAPISLRNSAGTCGYVTPAWARSALVTIDAKSRRAALAQELALYQDSSSIPYLHLVDGALSDNLGVRAAIDAIASLEGERDLASAVGTALPRRIVFIVVDAANTASRAIARQSHAPGELEAARLAALVAIDRYSVESKLVLRGMLDRLVARLASEQPTELYYIDVDPHAVRDRARREHLLSIPTSLSLPAAVVDQVVCAAGEILAAAPDYQRLVRDLGGSPPAAPECGR